MKDLTCGRDESFTRAGAIRDVGPRKTPVANGSAEGRVDALLQVSRGRRAVILQGAGQQGATRERGSTELARARVAIEQKQISRGVDSNDKDLLWLLAPTKFDK